MRSFKAFVKNLEERMHPMTWIFYFKDDVHRKEYEIFTFKMLGNPYQIIDKYNNKKYEYHYYYPEKGCSGAEVLANDKVFDGKSLKERWDSVVFISEE